MTLCCWSCNNEYDDVLLVMSMTGHVTMSMTMCCWSRNNGMTMCCWSCNNESDLVSLVM